LPFITVFAIKMRQETRQVFSAGFRRFRAGVIGAGRFQKANQFIDAKRAPIMPPIRFYIQSIQRRYRDSLASRSFTIHLQNCLIA